MLLSISTKLFHIPLTLFNILKKLFYTCISKTLLYISKALFYITAYDHVFVHSAYADNVELFIGALVQPCSGILSSFDPIHRR